MIEESGYSRLALAAAQALVDEKDADISVYLPSPTDGRPVLYRHENADTHKPNFDRLRAAGLTELYIRHDDLNFCDAFLEGKLADLLNNGNFTSTDKASIVRHVGTAIARDLTGKPMDGQGINRASSMVDRVLGAVLGDPLIAAHMLSMAGHERSTASHMFVVSALAVLLGAEVFGPDKRMLTELGMAGMMHDIGKLSIGPEILNKTTALTEREIKLIQQHPIESVRQLGSDPHITPSIRQMILQHHERVDGTGYPTGVRGMDLLPGSRVLAIVDSFHAMIGHRSYRRPLAPDEAIRALHTQAGRQFDADILAHWDRLFERHLSSAGGDFGWSRVAPPPVPTPDAKQELSSRNEHRPAPPRQYFGARSKRQQVHGKSLVRCVYAARLEDATCAPNEFEATLHDLSRGGMCLFNEHPMYRGEVLNVGLVHAGLPTWVRATVAWCRQATDGSYKVGLQLNQRIDETAVRQAVAMKGIADEFGQYAPAVNGNAEPAEDGPPQVKQAEADTSDLTATTPPKSPYAAEREIDEPLTGSDSVGEAPASEKALEQLTAIGNKRDPDATDEDIVVGLGQSSDPEVRRSAAEVLAKLGTKATRTALLGLLRDEDETVRESAAAVAGVFRMTETAYLLRQLLKDDCLVVALRAAGSLGRLGESDGLRLVINTLSGEGPHTRLAAMTFGEIVGHRFPANAQGVKAARRYMTANRHTLTA